MCDIKQTQQKSIARTLSFSFAVCLAAGRIRSRKRSGRAGGKSWWNGPEAEQFAEQSLQNPSRDGKAIPRDKRREEEWVRRYEKGISEEIRQSITIGCYASVDRSWLYQIFLNSHPSFLE